jgi:hypothetical protein
MMPASPTTTAQPAVKATIKAAENSFIKVGPDVSNHRHWITFRPCSSNLPWNDRILKGMWATRLTVDGRLPPVDPPQIWHSTPAVSASFPRPSSRVLLSHADIDATVVRDPLPPVGIPKTRRSNCKKRTSAEPQS